jgi:hypothetical protein
MTLRRTGDSMKYGLLVLLPCLFAVCTEVRAQAPPSLSEIPIERCDIMADWTPFGRSGFRHMRGYHRSPRNDVLANNRAAAASQSLCSTNSESKRQLVTDIPTVSL